MRRRTFLVEYGGVAGAGALSACLGGPVGSVGTPTRPDDGDGATTPTDTSFSVLDRACGSGANAATIRFEADAVAVDGVIGGRDGCDTAQLASVSVASDELTVTVGVVEAPRTEPAACVQCLTDVEYAFAATFPDDGPASVRVVHRTADGESTVATASRA